MIILDWDIVEIVWSFSVFIVIGFDRSDCSDGSDGTDDTNDTGSTDETTGTKDTHILIAFPMRL